MVRARRVTAADVAFLTLPGAQAAGALAGVPAGLRHPCSDGLDRRLALPSRTLRRTPPTRCLIESPFSTVWLRQRVTKGAGSRSKGLLMAFMLLDMA